MIVHVPDRAYIFGGGEGLGIQDSMWLFKIKTKKESLKDTINHFFSSDLYSVIVL